MEVSIPCGTIVTRFGSAPLLIKPSRDHFEGVTINASQLRQASASERWPAIYCTGTLRVSAVPKTTARLPTDELTLYGKVIRSTASGVSPTGGPAIPPIA